MYDQIATYYDLTHADLTADIPFILELTQQSGGPVLELGCGSGRILLPLARAGQVITGLDNSPAMLARARARLAQEPDEVRSRVTLVETDMTGLDEGDGRFAFIFIPYNTFMHLDSAQAAVALKQARTLLQPGGTLFIDLANPFTIADTPEDQLLSLENVLTDPSTGDMIVHLAVNRLDTVEQTLLITWIYDRSSATGGAVHRTVAQSTYHYRYPHQMELLLRDAGFSHFELWGDYDQSSFHEESPRLLVQCSA